MKQKLLFLFFSLLISTSICAQVVGQKDDFEDGTVQGWIIGPFASPPNPATNVSTDGPAGAGDNFLQYASTGTSGAGSKMVILNQDSRWTGNLTSANIVRIKMDVRVTEADLNLRISFDGAGGRISTTNAVSITAGTGWQSIIIPISSSDMTHVQGGNATDIASTLANVSEIRILSNSSSPSWFGDVIDSTLDVDNIEAATFLNTRSSKLKNAFSISPNPGRDKLNLRLSKLSNNTTVEVFDVLGKKIYADKVNTMTKTVNVSRWNNGVYLVRLISDEGTQTKRFVKQ